MTTIALLVRPFCFVFFLLFIGCVGDVSRHSESTQVEDLLPAPFHQLDQLVFSQPDSALVLAEALFDSGQQQNDLSLKARALLFKGHAWSSKSDYQQAKRCFQQSHDLYKEIGDSLQMWVLLRNIGHTHIELKEPIAAISYLEQSLAIARAMQHPDTSNLEGSIGVFYFDAQNYDAALACFQRNLSEAELRKDTIAMAKTYTNLGTVYRQLGQHHLALRYYELALESSSSKANDVYQAVFFSNLGIAQYLTGDTVQAFVNGQKSLDYFTRMGNHKGIANSLSWVGTYHLDRAPDLSVEFGERALKLAQAKQLPEQTGIAAELLSKAYERTGRSAEALTMFRLKEQMNDSIYSTDRIKAGLLYQLKHQQENAPQTASVSSQQASRPSQELYAAIGYMVLGIFSFLVLVGLVWIFRVKRRKIESLKEAEVEVSTVAAHPPLTKVNLNREKLEVAINRKLNSTDWEILQLLVEDASLTNPEIAEKICMSREGVVSSLRKMYRLFDLRDRSNKRLALIQSATSISSDTPIVSSEVSLL